MLALRKYNFLDFNGLSFNIQKIIRIKTSESARRRLGPEQAQKES
jgi:hypothetical protein